MNADPGEELRAARPQRHEMPAEVRRRVHRRLDALMAEESDVGAPVEVPDVGSDESAPKDHPTRLVLETGRPGGPTRRRAPVVAAIVAAAALAAGVFAVRLGSDPEQDAVRQATRDPGDESATATPIDIDADSDPTRLDPLVAALVAETETEGLAGDALVALVSVDPAAGDLDAARQEVGPVVVAAVACAWADSWSDAVGEDPRSADRAANALRSIDDWPLVAALADVDLVGVVTTVAESIGAAHAAGDPSSAPDHRPQICLDG